MAKRKPGGQRKRPAAKGRRPKSQAQARLFGAFIGAGFKPRTFRDKLRGVRVKSLPRRKRKR